MHVDVLAVECRYAVMKSVPYPSTTWVVLPSSN